MRSDPDPRRRMGMRRSPVFPLRGGGGTASQPGRTSQSARFSEQILLKTFGKSKKSNIFKIASAKKCLNTWNNPK